jgi:hypothetical protein
MTPLQAASGGGAAAEDGADAGGGEGGGADGEASSSNLVGKKASELTREEQFELITGRKAPTKGAGGGEGGGKPIKVRRCGVMRKWCERKEGTIDFKH